MNRHSLSIFFFLVLVSGQIFSQKILVLEKKAKFKTYMYREGETISLQMDSIKIKGKITLLTDSAVVLNNRFHVPLRRIDYIKRRRFWLKLNTASVKGFSILYLFGSVAGRAVRKDYPVLRSSDFLISIALYASAVLLQWVWYKKYYPGKKWQLKVIDLSL